MQGLRSEHDIDVRRPGDDRRAFLTCHATADTDEELRIRSFQPSDTSQIVKHALLRFFANRTGVEQDYVGFVSVFRELEALGRVQYVGHPGRIVFIHLAAEGTDVKLVTHDKTCRTMSYKRWRL